MAEVAVRLLRCFSSVFPGLTAEQIRAACAELLSAWDSLTAVRLLAVLEQEFGLEISVEDMQNLKSYHQIYNYLINNKVNISNGS